MPLNPKVTCLNDYHPVALTFVAMKCFERLIMAHINTVIPETIDPLQFAYRPNRYTDDAISIALHTALSHLDKRNTDVKMLFIDYSSAFNPIVSSKLINKLTTLGLNTSLCNWILDFLKGRPQVVRVSSNTSAMLILNTGVPQGVRVGNNTSAANVSKTFKQVSRHKAAGPDGLPGRVLRARADQLASVFTDIFKHSLSESVSPTCFKQTNIVPVPKNTKVTCLNDNLQYSRL